MAEQTQLLLAEADGGIREILRLAAAQEGWGLRECQDGVQALKFLKRESYHLLVLCAELPEVDGITVCRFYRRSGRAPVIFLSADGKEANRLACFGAGGNDFVHKPFFPRELVARIHSLLGLCGVPGVQARTLKAGEVEVELASRSVRVDGRRVTLSPKEYDLLLFLCRHPHQAFTRDALLDAVWGQEFYGSDRTVDTHVKSLRGKLRPYHNYVETVWGIGYRFVPEG